MPIWILRRDGALWGGFGTTGQRCTAASRLIVHESIHDSFLDRFLPRVKALTSRKWIGSKSEMGPCINETQLKKVEYYVQTGRDEGAKLLCGGERLKRTKPMIMVISIAPTVFADVTGR